MSAVYGVFSNLPLPLIPLIFSHFDSSFDLGRQARVCKLFKAQSETNDLWKRLLQRDFPNQPIFDHLNAKRNYAQTRSAQFHQNLKKRNYSSVSLVDFQTCISYLDCCRDFLVAAGSYDSYKNSYFFRIWKRDVNRVYQIYQTVIKKSDSIRGVKLGDGFLFTLSENQTHTSLKVWKEGETCFETIQNVTKRYYSFGLFCLEYHNKTLVKASKYFIEVFKQDTTGSFQLHQTLEAGAICLCMKDDLLILGAKNVIEIWKESKGYFEKINSFKTDESWLDSLYFKEHALFTSYDNVVKHWEKDAEGIFKIQQSLEGHNFCVTAIAFHEGLLFTGSLDKTLRVWEKNGDQYVEKIQLLKRDERLEIFFLKFLENQLFVGTLSEVRIFDFYQKSVTVAPS